MKKITGRRSALQANQIAIAVAAAFAPWGAYGQTPLPNTLPTNGVVTHGAGTIHAPVHAPGLSTMQIDQGTSRMAARFDSFSIGSSAHVNVSQPSSSSIALFKDVGGSVSQIYGGLTANGQIFISNPNGVLIGRTGRVEAAGFVASTLSLNENEFMLGGNSFNWINNGANGTVTNEGTIFTLGGYTMLAGPQVRNDGLIMARTGSVVLAAGDRVALDLIGDGLISVSVEQAALSASIVNTGAIEADGGKVLLTARSANALMDTVVNAGGVIRANSLIERNGEIILDGGSTGTALVSGQLHSNGRIDVSGHAVTVSGGIFAQNGTLALTTTGVDSNLLIENSIVSTGTQTFNAAGDMTVDASDRSIFVETSGPQVFRVEGALTVKAGTSREARVLGQHQDVAAGQLVVRGGTNAQAVLESRNGQTISASVIRVEGAPVGGSPQVAIRADSGQQTVTANEIVMSGGIGSDNSLWILAFDGPQDVIASRIRLEGGSGSRNQAYLRSDGGPQKIVADQISIDGGSGSNNSLWIVGQKDAQEITASGITMVGGSGSRNHLNISSSVDFFLNGSGDQRISANSVSLNGGSGSNNYVTISAGKGNQLLDASIVDLAGGTGAQNQVSIQSNFIASDTTHVGDQSISADALRLIGDGAQNFVSVFNQRGSQTLDTATLSLDNGSGFTSVTGSGLPQPGVVRMQTISSDSIQVKGGSISGQAQTVTVGGDIRLEGGSISGSGGQALTARFIEVLTQNGRPAGISNFGGGEQKITAAHGIDIRTTIGGGTAEIRNNSAADQTITVSGDHLTIQGMGGGVAQIASTGNQNIRMTAAGPRRITVGDHAAQGRSSITSSGDQTISGNADIVITGGSGPIADGSNASIAVTNSSRVQRIDAGTVTLANSVFGGNNSFAGIQATNQFINASGSVTLTANASGGSLPGARIGGPGGAGATATNLVLNVGGDLVLTGGTAANNGVGIGSSAAPTAPLLANNITIDAGGSVILNPGALEGTGVRIGSGSNGTAGGSISIDAGGSIHLNGTQRSAAIRTLGDVTLDASSISETGNGTITAGTLKLSSAGDALLNGPNQVGSLSAPDVQGVPPALQRPGVGGNLSFTNSGALNVSDVSVGGGLTLNNTGAVTVRNAVTSNGAMNLNVTGDMAVTASGTQDATLRALGGQTISARSLAVTSSDGRFASVSNTGGAQTINLSNGAGLDVRTQAFGGSAQISNDGGAGQTINVVNGDHISVNGAGGVAGIYGFGGTQSLSITGSGANAITIGAAGSLGPSQVMGGVQNVTAGTGTQSGSITIVGGNGDATFTGLSSGQIIDGTQTVSTSGTLRITGGDAPNQPVNGFATGLFHNGTGEQKVSAGNLAMQGGTSGLNNVAIIISSGGNGTIASGDQVIEVGTGNVSLTGGPGGSGNTAIIVSFADQTVGAGSVTLQGGTGGATNGAFINSVPGGQLFNVAGELRVSGGAGGSAGINNGSTSPLNSGASQVINAGSVLLQGGAGGSGNGAFINSNFGGAQTLTVPGTIRVTGGSGGVGNRAGIVTNANQAIHGNPDIFLSGGSGGGVAGNGNNVFIQAAGADTTSQTINARSVQLSSGAGIDASATFNAARQAINATGDVSLFGGGGAGGSNGARIGGLGGSTLGPTNLTLGVAGNLLLRGGTANGVSLGSSGASTEPNNIVVTAGNVTLESAGAGARIGASNQVPVPSGSIAVTTGSLQLGTGTAIRANGPITLTANSLTNAGTITNGGGANSANMIFSANAFNLGAGQVTAGNAAVVLRPRTGTNTFEIESAGATPAATATRISNADIASIDTANFVVFGSGLGSFTGNMVIGQNARVDAAGKNLAFFRTGAGTTTIGAQGIGTTGDVIIGSNGGSIVSNGGVVTGDEIQLRATLGIGTSGASVRTDANALSIVNSTFGVPPFVGGNVFVSEANDVTLRNTTLFVGGMTNSASNFVSGSLDFSAGGNVTVAGTVQSIGPMNVTTGGALTLAAAGLQDAILRADNGGQTVTAQSVNVSARDGRLAQILNSGGNQTVTASTLDLRTQAGGGTAEIRNGTAGEQTINAAGGSITLRGADSGVGRTAIFSGGNQTINGHPDLFLTGGGTGVVGAGNDARIETALGPARQTVHAGRIVLENSPLANSGTFSGLISSHQDITTTGDVSMSSGLGAHPGNVRMQGGNGATDLRLNVGGSLILTGGNAPGGGVGLGSSAVSNNITIDATGDVILNSGVNGARIGSSSDGTVGGDISITARNIALNGTALTAAIRTLDTVTLRADQPGGTISQSGNGLIIAGSLVSTSDGSTSLSGPNNQIARFNGTSGSDLTLNNTGALEVTGLSAAGDATLTNVGNVTVSGPWIAGGSTHISAHSDIVLAALLSSANASLEADGVLTQFGTNGVGAVLADTLTTVSSGSTFFSGENRVASYNGTSGADLLFFNRGALNVAGVNAGSASLSNEGSLTISGPWITSGQTNINSFGPGSSIAESGGGFIQAAGFNNSLSAQGSINLNGPNRISGTLFGSSMQGDFRLTNAGDLNLGASAFVGDVALMNAGALNVSSLNARNAAVTNAGPMTVSGFWSSTGTTSITTLGAGGDLTVNNTVTSQGAMTVNVDGALTVAASGLQVIPPPLPGVPPVPPPPLPVPQIASLTSSGGQSITANSMVVSAQDGGLALITNQNTGNQSLTVSGGGLDIRSAGGAPAGPGSSNAQVGNFGNGSQTITVSGPRGVSVTSNGGLALIGNSGTSGQRIEVSGGGNVDVQSLHGNGFASISNNPGAGNQAIVVTGGDHISVDGISGFASISASGGQEISITGSGANALVIGSGGALGGSSVFGQSQVVTAGASGEAGSIHIVGSDAQGRAASLSNQNVVGGTQNVSTSGLLRVTGGTASTQNVSAGIFHNGSGDQTVNAARIELHGGAAGNNNAALIVANNGAQNVTVVGDIDVAGGAGGNAGILGSATRLQTILAEDVRLTNSAGGGINSVGFIQGGHQQITASGDVLLEARASGGDLPGIRIGGLAGNNPTATDLTLNVGRDLILQGGTAVNNGVGIGSTAATGVPPLRNDITINAGRDVKLYSGVATSGVRIGSPQTGAGEGSINITAGGHINLNGVDEAASIRTLGSATLRAASITEAAQGRIIAGNLNTNTSGHTLLTGPNQVSMFNGTATGGDLALNNSGALTVTGLHASNATLTNAGDVTVSGPWNSSAASITTTGAGSDLTVTSAVTSIGAMNVNVAGDIAVTALAGQDAMLGSFGGQAISARSLAVTSNGGFARVWNTGPDTQTITISNGRGVDVQTLASGGFAQISADASGTQTINVLNGDHINVNGAQGFAGIFNSGGAQTLSITGSGANAITLGAAGSLGPSVIGGGVQDITAGASGQSGSISIVGGDANQTFTGFSSGQIIGGTQTVSTSGTLRITGGNAPNQPTFGFATGLFHNGSGEQRVNAATIEMQGGAGGNNTAIIISSGGAGTIAAGDQVIDVAGGSIKLAGGVGTGNTAIIVSSANQSITAGSVELRGGQGTSSGAFLNAGSPSGSAQLLNVAGAITVEGGNGTNNGAGIFQTGTGPQTITAGSIDLRGGASGINNGAFINVTGGGVAANAGTQAISASGDIDIAGGAGGNAGISGPAARLQSIRAANIHLSNSAAGGFNSVGFILGGHQDIRASGDLTMTARASGGDLPGVRIGGLSGASATSTDLVLNVGGDLVLTGGTLAGNGVGIGSTAAPGPSFANNITINTGGDVILNSGVPGSAARIGSSATTGPAGGDIQITAGGDIRLNGVNENAAIRTLGSMSLQAASITEGPKGLIEAGTLHTKTSGDTLLGGPNRVGSFTAESDHGNVHLTNTSAVLTLGAMDLPGALSIVQTGNVAVGNASATEATVIAAAGDVSVSATGHIFVRGSDTTAGAGAGVLAEGHLAFSAGDVTLRAGDAAMTPVVVRGANGVEMTVGNELNVTGGGGFLSPALLSSGGDIDLTLGQAVRVDGGSGFLSIARVQTETTDGVIRLTFPNLTEGGYFVNGIEGRRHNDDSGFYSVLKPAKVGKTLLLEYGN